MKLTIEIFDTNGRIIDNKQVTESQETLNFFGVLDIKFEENRFFITPTVGMYALKIKHGEPITVGANNSAKFGSLYSQTEVICDKPYYWLKPNDFIIFRPDKLSIQNSQVADIIITCD